MKYSFMSFSTPKLSLKEIIETAKRFGYDGIEPRLDSGHSHGIEISTSADYLAEALKISEAAGIAFACIATQCKLANPDGIAGQIEAAERAVDLAKKLNCHAIRVFGGKLPEGLSRDKAMATLKEALSKIVKYAAGSGVNICLETHDDWCDPVMVREAAKDSGSSVNWDVMHTFMTAKYSPEKAFDILKPYIRHMHIHDGIRENGKTELCPIGKGEIDHTAPIRLMNESGYQGYASGEWINWEPWEIHLPREIAALKKL